MDTGRKFLKECVMTGGEFPTPIHGVQRPWTLAAAVADNDWVAQRNLVNLQI